MLRTFFAVVLSTAALQAQPAPKRTQVSGTVTSVDAAAGRITLKSDQGATVAVSTTARTVLLKIPPGETDPQKGAKITLADVSTGDRAVVVAPQGPDTANYTATAVLVMSRGDVATLRAREDEDWKKRGTTGNVSAIDAAAKTIAIKAGARNFTLTTSDKTTYFRYAPDSAQFTDAKPSSFGEIKAGDQARVLGNRSGDAASIAAEKIVFGSFRQIAATITAVDAAQNEITVKDLASKGAVTLKVVAETVMKKLPAEMAVTLARRYKSGGGAGDVGQMLDSLGRIALAELKKGDALMISTTQGSDVAHATAIMLLAGVEPLLTASPTATRDIMGGWNLGGSSGEGQ
jgi:hypothetical protein